MFKDAVSTCRNHQMPPVPVIPTVLEPGQTRLSFDGLGIVPKRSGPPPKSVYKVPTQFNRRWLFGSSYELGLARQFQTARILAQDLKSDPKGLALHRRSYSRELKLAAIEWATNTYIKGKRDKDLDVKLLRYKAAKRLGITSTMLRNWIRNKGKIATSRKALRRAQTSNPKGREHKMEQALFKEFKEARSQGKAVGCQ
jgi:hypothetical protein